MSMVRGLLALMVIVGAGYMPAWAQEDAVGVPGPVVYDGTSFELAWTTHPTETFYKQEYVPEGQTVERYDEMFMVDVLTEGPTPDAAAQSIVESLGERKGTDPVVNFQVMKNEATGEVLLDFLLSSDEGGTLIVEWNAYRYVPVGDGVAMFGISRRGYDDGAADLLMALKDWRMGAIEELAGMELPEIVVE
ncbi:hypothetical protein [Devosia sp. Leaf64]|uniref:hypothetical protein n=1 Tax=Devosia sp. Leaf64 TaxID=1736229 RepID=UPI0007137D97|nr:hypothetical protein [Devosia sp. Leaf64]KQN72795.1 hypothetical protein ASE94_09980 [Devosia sp. Leaf64]